MSKVTVKYRGPLAEMTGIPSQELEASAVRDVLKHIKDTWGKEAAVTAKRMIIAVNGKSILLLKNEKTVLSDGDVLSFLPICGGG